MPKNEQAPTPGPWSINTTANADQPVIQAPGTRPKSWRMVAQVYETSMLKDEPIHAHSDARLIVKAPELARVLADLVTRCDGPSGVRPDGSNIDTLEAHHLLAEIDPDTWDEKEVV